MLTGPSSSLVSHAPSYPAPSHASLWTTWSLEAPLPPGRTHRSNQVSAPEYIFLISELAGERRFASIVAKRLESLVSEQAGRGLGQGGRVQEERSSV